MITVGIDLASQPKKTGVARVRWEHRRAVVEDVSVGANDNDLIGAIGTSDKTGIDCPFGWPDEFVDFVSAHRDGTPRVPMTGPAWTRRLALRATDRAVHDETGLWPLSVATDRIAYPAMRCAELLRRLGGDGINIDLAGIRGPVVEVYPKASLNRWKLATGLYKRKQNVTALRSLFDSLRRDARWLDLGSHDELCRSNDDAFDALICALTARAVTLDLTTWPTEHFDHARREGWIAVPTCELGDLVRA